jgi:hypothetical protein
MRGRRRFLGAMLACALLLGTAADATANGGAYLEFDRTHYLPGDAGVATTYVSVPRRKAHLFDRGPFYLFAVPNGMSLLEGQPIPSGAIRLGTVTIEEEKDQYELVAEFNVPEIGPGFYEIGVCNDPCTISGFRESLGGRISIVETRREAELLTHNAELRGRLFGVRREARRAERRLEAAEGELETQLTFGASERDRMTAQIERLQTQLAAARERAAAPLGRVPFDPWVVGAIPLVALVAAVLAFRRRRMLPALRDLYRQGTRARDGERPPAASSEVHGWDGNSRSGARSSRRARRVREDRSRAGAVRSRDRLPRASARRDR